MKRIFTSHADKLFSSFSARGIGSCHASHQLKELPADNERSKHHTMQVLPTLPKYPAIALA